MTELATGYISLVVETSKIPGQVGQAMKGVEAQADKTGRTMGDRLASGLKRTAAAGGLAAGAALGTAITKGVGRLNSIEQAEAKLAGLGNSAADVGDIMDNALASVRGTSYGLEEAATIAASAVAAGIKPGQDLERTLKMTGDAAAIAGTDLASMGSIINKVATADMMQMDVANQLMDAGIPILQMVSEELGVTAEEARKMASAGEISFEAFQSALEDGVGGAALKMGETTEGAFRNMGAAAGRLGATLAGPFFDQAGSAFTGLTGLIDSLDAKAGPAMDSIDAWLSGTVVPGLTDLAGSAREAWESFASSDVAQTSLVRLSGLLDDVVDMGGRLADAGGRIGVSLAKASASIGVSTWEMLLAALESTAVILDATLVPALELTADLMSDNQGAVTTLVAAFMAFKTVPGIMSRIAPVFTPIVSGAKTARTNLADFSGAVRDSHRWMSQANPEMGRLGITASVLGANASAAARGGLTAMRRAGSNLLGVFGGPLGAAVTGVTVAVTAGVSANQKLEASQESLEDASQDLAAAQSAMWSKIGDAAGVADAVVDQIRAIRDEMDAAIAGEQRGFGAMMAQAWNDLGLTLKDNFTFDFTPEASGTGEAQKLANDLADAAELAKDALDELGLSNDELAAKISGNAADWEIFRAQLVATGDGGEEAASKLDGLRAEFERLEAAERTATPGMFDLSDAVDVLADSSATADEHLNALQDALKALGIMASDAETSAFELAVAVEEVAQKAAEGIDPAGGLGKELLTLEGGLDGSKENAQALVSELEGLGTKFRQHATDTGDAAAAYEMVSPALENLAQMYDLPIDKIEELAAKWGGLDAEAVDLLVRVDGADEARKKVTEVALALGEIDDGEPKTISMMVEDQAARDALVALGLDVEAIEGQPGMVRITADGTVAVSAMNAITQQLVGLDSSVATPDILADTTVFRLEDQAVQDALRNLDYSHVDPSIGAIIDDFIAGRDVTLEELARIDATVADPHITAEIAEALEKAKIINDALDRAARSRTATITTVSNMVQGTSLPSTSLPSLPGAAGGMRLPTSGPGTSMIDGFLGVDDSGMAVARVNRGEWVINGDSSDDYHRVLSAINRDDPSVQHLKGYQNGGRVSADEVLDFLHARTPHGQSQSLQGAPYLWAQVNWGDCSAAQAAAWNFATGQDPFATRFATGNQLEAIRAMGGKPGPGGPDDLTTAWYNGGPGGGHTTGHVGGVNFEMGGGAGGMGKIGGAAASPFHGPWQHIYHLPLADPFDWSDSTYTGRRGAGLTIGDYTASAFSGRTAFGASGGSRSGAGAGRRPATWSELAGDAAAQFVGGLTEDALGVFGVPNMLPPALQAWQMLNEPVGDGPTDWDLSVIAARVKQLDAEVKIREQFVDEAGRAIEGINQSPVGNALPAQMVAAQDQLDAEKRELDRVRTEWEGARTHLEKALAARAEVLAEADNRGASDRELAETAASEVDELADQIDTSHTYDPSRGAEQWTPLIDRLLLEKGLPLSYRGAVIDRMDQESDGNPLAVNDWDSNAAAGNPSKGGMQTTQTTFDAFADPGHGDIWSMEDNLRASMNYVMRDPKFAGRTLEDVYRQAGGYFLGGEVTLPSGMQAGVDNVPAWLTVGERVVRNGPSQKYAQEIDAMNAGTYAGRGDEMHFHYQVLSNDEADRHRRNTERQRAAEKVGIR